MKLNYQQGFVTQGIIAIVILVLIAGGIYYGAKSYQVKQPLTYVGITEVSKAKFSIRYPSSWVYFKFSCSVGGLAFWPKTTAPAFPAENKCPSAVVGSAPIIITTDTKLEMIVNDLKYQEATKQFTTTLE